MRVGVVRVAGQRLHSAQRRRRTVGHHLHRQCRLGSGRGRTNGRCQPQNEAEACIYCAQASAPFAFQAPLPSQVCSFSYLSWRRFM